MRITINCDNVEKAIIILENFDKEETRKQLESFDTGDILYTDFGEIEIDQ